MGMPDSRVERDDDSTTAANKFSHLWKYFDELIDRILNQKLHQFLHSLLLKSILRNQHNLGSTILEKQARQFTILTVLAMCCLCSSPASVASQ